MATCIKLTKITHKSFCTIVKWRSQKERDQERSEAARRKGLSQVKFLIILGFLFTLPGCQYDQDVLVI